MERGYLYQTIHTVGHSALYLDEHCRLLENAFMELLFRPLKLDRAAIGVEITELLRSERLTAELSVFVDLCVSMSGEYLLRVNHLSIYDGYTLRCTTPRAVLIDFVSPFGFAPTSVRRDTVAMANAIAQSMGGDLAIESRNEHVYTIGGSPLFMVNGRTLTTPPIIESVERQVLIDAAEKCGSWIEQREIEVNELLTCDELLIADHYGVTAVSLFEHRSYANDIALKISEILTQPF